MSRTAIGMGSLSLYLYGSGLTLAHLSNYWSGLPLGPRDGQAFMAAGLLGGLMMIVGLSFGAAVLLSRPGGSKALAIAIAVALAAAVAITNLRVVDLSLLTVLPGGVPIAMLIRMPRVAALRIALPGLTTSAAFAAYAYLTGPQAWLTRGMDGSVLAIWLVLAVVATAVGFPRGATTRASSEA